jgi:hypothetical protein
MVGGLKPMTSKQLPPNCADALEMLRALLAECTYPDLDLDNKDDSMTLLARRQVAEASLQRLEIELGFRSPPLRRQVKQRRRRKGS